LRSERRRHAYAYHAPEYLHGDGMIDYVNCGDWKGSNTYVEIEKDRIALMHYQ
jgi:hypothetical protein